MRIALVSTVSAPIGKDAWGSVEAWTWLLMRELRQLGHEVTVFGCAGSEAEGEVVECGPFRELRHMRLRDRDATGDKRTPRRLVDQPFGYQRLISWVSGLSSCANVLTAPGKASR